MAGVGGAAVPGRLSLAGTEARPTELFSYKRTIKRLLLVILSLAKNLSMKSPRYFTPWRSVQNDMNIQGFLTPTSAQARRLSFSRGDGMMGEPCREVYSMTLSSSCRGLSRRRPEI